MLGIFLLMVIACTKEEIFPLPLVIDGNFSLKSFNNPVKDYLTISWSDYKNREKAANTRRTTERPPITEYRAQLNGNLTVDDGLASRMIKFSLIAVADSTNTLQYALLKFVPASDTIDTANVSYLELNGFTGTIYVYDENAVLKAVEGYDKGVIQLRVTEFDENAEASERVAYEPPIEFDCGYTICGGGGGYVSVRVFIYKDWYVSVNSGPFRYSGTDYMGSEVRLVYVPPRAAPPPPDQHEHFEAPHGGNLLGSAHVKEIIMDPSFKGSKAECVYNKIVSLKSMQSLIQRFDGTFPVAHLKFATADLANTQRAITSPPNGYVITITLNNDNSINGFGYRPILMTTKTIIHEVIHAEMFRKLLSLANNNGSIDSNALQNMLANGDYPGILD
ncbi:MAG: hypothetical protein U5K79_17320 [Cyclobacteriaceae bacterium]|nr:hypothetical protein [Cyclobacteriaceae bacterium]